MENHCKRIENLGEWGTQVEIFAAATISKIQIFVYSPANQEVKSITDSAINRWGEVTLLASVPLVYRNYGSLHLQVITTLN